MLITKVKVGNVTNLSEARYCAGMGVDFLSFPVSQVDPKMYQEITAWVTGPKFGIEVEAANAAAIAQYRFNFIQTKSEIISGFKSVDNLFVTVSSSDWLIRKNDLLAIKDRIQYLELDYLLLDESTVKLIEEISSAFDVFLKPAGLVELEAMLKLPVAGISLEGSTEAKPGLKEYPLSEILEMLEAVD